jgi:hypothetical protein
LLAGRFDWLPAWVSMAVILAWIMTTAIVIFRFHPHLLAERLRPCKGAKHRDTAIMSILGLT